MGVFGELLGFDGRIDRLGYLWRSLAAAAALGALAAAAGLLLVFVVQPSGVSGSDVWMQRLVALVFLLALWSSFALATRRLRDMGLEPTHVVPLYVALWVMNSVLIEPLSRVHPQMLAPIEAAWSSLQWMAAIPLLLWPSRHRAGAPQAGFEPAGPTAYLNWRESG